MDIDVFAIIIIIIVREIAKTFFTIANNLTHDQVYTSDIQSRDVHISALYVTSIHLICGASLSSQYAYI